MFDLWQGIIWIFNPENYQGSYPLQGLLVEHLILTFLALFPALIIAVPLGIFIGYIRKGSGVVIGVSSLTRAIPTLGLLLALVLWLGVSQRTLALTLALTVVAIAPILASTFSGVSAIAPSVNDIARSQGMKPLQIVMHVQIPLSLPQIVGGLRIAWLQVVSTVVLAPIVGLGGLGFGIVQGLSLRNYPQVIGSALIIVMLTITVDQLLRLCQKIVANKYTPQQRSLDVKELTP